LEARLNQAKVNISFWWTRICILFNFFETKNLSNSNYESQSLVSNVHFISMFNKLGSI